jgi:hypothetical protein
VQQADNKGASTSCTCLKQHLGDDEEQDDDENVATRCIARWIVDHYAGLTPEQRNEKLTCWIRHSLALQAALGTKRGQQFLLPMTALDGDDTGFSSPPLICQSALMQLLGIGRVKWASVKKAAETNVEMTHGLKSKANGNRA